MLPIEKPKMTLSTWYGGALHIPNYGNWFFPGFATGCLGLVRSVLRREMDTKITVRFCRMSTASADQKTNTINISEEFLKGRVPKRKEKLDSEGALTLITGIIVHEAAHFAWSPETLEPAAHFIKEYTPFPYQEKLACGLANIIEDIFIEAEVEREIPSLFWSLEYMREVFHPESKFLADVESTKEVMEPPTSMGVVLNLTNLLINAKVREEIESNPWVTALYRKALSARVTSSVAARYSLTLEIYNLLMERITEEECESGSGGEEGDSEMDGELKDLLDKILGATADHSKPPKVSMLGDHEVNKGSLTDLLDKTEDAEFQLAQVDTGFDFKEILYVEKPVAPVENTVVIDSRYNLLAEMARQRATVNRPYGLDMNRGHTIRKLHRIATDSKIFAEPVRMGAYQPLRAGILVDCSGSMAYGRRIGERGFLSRNTRIGKACDAAAGAALGLVEGRCEVAVFGHTADVFFGSNDVTIYRFKDFNEPIDALPARLSAVKEEDFLEQNKDGFAIQYVARKLLGTSKKKILIVISDGSPYAPRYSGERANEHSKEMVDEARALGIEVVSISISEEAKETNDFIYGASKNVYNEDPNCIADIVRSIYL
jgi:hypothetical protein